MFCLLIAPLLPCAALAAQDKPAPVEGLAAKIVAAATDDERAARRYSIRQASRTSCS
jgi:hypothetical protein